MHSREALGQSEAFLDFQEHLSRVAPVDRPVLLIGERGTGKELAASRLHYLSGRWDRPFVTLNCSTLAPSLIEAELFGYEKGAFTGAENRRVGRFEAAHTGTLFLDEIGSIPLQAQEKILRVVEYSVFERVGSPDPIEVDVRIVCATNVDLKAKAEKGEFKPDLLDRLSFEVLFLPPLRYRDEDIMLLANHFGQRMGYELGIENPVEFSERATRALQNYPWPGNIRELKNVVERAVYLSDSGSIDRVDFDPFRSPFRPRPQEKEVSARSSQAFPMQVTPYEPAEPRLEKGLREQVRQLEISLIQAALQKSRFNQKNAARLLQLSYDQFRGLVKKYRDELG